MGTDLEIESAADEVFEKGLYNEVSLAFDARLSLPFLRPPLLSV